MSREDLHRRLFRLFGRDDVDRHDPDPGLLDPGPGPGPSLFPDLDLDLGLGLGTGLFLDRAHESESKDGFTSCVIVEQGSEIES